MHNNLTLLWDSLLSPTNLSLLAIAGSLASGLTGYWLGRNQTRIADLNPLLQEVRRVVRPTASAASISRVPGSIDPDTLHKLQRLLRNRQWRRLRKAVQAYDQARSAHQANALGEQLVDDPAAVIAAARRVLDAAGHQW